MPEKNRVLLRTYYVMRVMFPGWKNPRYYTGNSSDPEISFRHKSVMPPWLYKDKEKARSILRALRKAYGTTFDHGARIVTVRVYGWRLPGNHELLEKFH